MSTSLKGENPQRTNVETFAAVFREVIFHALFFLWPEKPQYNCGHIIIYPIAAVLLKRGKTKNEHANSARPNKRGQSSQKC